MKPQRLFISPNKHSIPDTEVKGFFRLTASSSREELREIESALNAASSELEDLTGWGFGEKNVTLYYSRLLQGDRIPYAPCTVTSMADAAGDLLDTDALISGSQFPRARRTMNHVTVSVRGGYAEVPSDWQELIMRLALVRMDSKGMIEEGSASRRSAEQEILHQARLKAYILVI